MFAIKGRMARLMFLRKKRKLDQKFFDDAGLAYVRIT